MMTSSNSNSSSVQVVVRLRPLNEKEKKHGTLPVVSASTADTSVTVIKGSGSRQARSSYNFDNVFTAFSTQEEVFDATLKPILRDVMRGFESTVFAYGQTGTGKTHTMEGDIDNPDLQGVIPRSAKAIFEALESPEYTQSSVTVSFLEIYNEELCDLLKPDQNKLDIMVGKNGPFCRGLSSSAVQNADQVLQLMRRAQNQRQVGETSMNKQSSRSHCIFTLSIKAKRSLPGEKSVLEIGGKLHCVDLAGSECAKSADLEKGNESQVARERERKNINRSLLTLGRVVSMLKEQSSSKKKQNVRIPYRDSKLTRILQESLGGRCKTCLIATISPSVTAIEESMSTLNYAHAANGIVNKPVTTSFLSSSSSMSSAVSTSKSNNNEAGAVELWHEMETRLEYMKNQVEEAQQALARKHLQQQELVEKADKAEELKNKAEHLLGVAKAENINLQEEIQVHKNEKEQLEQELSTTQSTLKETTVILKATQTTEESLTNEAHLLLKTLQQTIQTSESLHGDLVQKRQIEVQRKLATKQFHDSSVLILKSIHQALDSLKSKEHDFLQLTRGSSQEMFDKMTRLFRQQHESIDKLSCHVHESAETMYTHLKCNLVTNASDTHSEIQMQLQDVQKLVENGNEDLVDACRKIQQHLNDCSSQLDEMHETHQSYSKDVVTVLIEKLSNSTQRIKSMVSSATSSLSNIQKERAESIQALDNVLLQWESSSRDSTSFIQSTAGCKKDDILDMLKLLAERKAGHDEMDQSLANQRTFVATQQHSLFDSLHSTRDLLEDQNQAFQHHFDKEADFRKGFMQTVMNGVQGVLQQQLKLWEHQSEKRIEDNLQSNSDLSKQQLVIQSSSKNILASVKETNEELVGKVSQVRQTHDQVSNLLHDTTGGFKHIQEKCCEQLSSVKEHSQQMSNQLRSLETTQEESVEHLQRNLESDGKEIGGVLNDDAGYMQTHVRQLADSTNKMVGKVQQEAIEKMKLSVEEHIQKDVGSLVESSLASIGQISAIANEGEIKLEQDAHKQHELLGTMETFVKSSAKKLQSTIRTKSTLMDDFNCEVSTSLAKHESTISDSIQECQGQTGEACSSSKTFTFETIGATKQTPVVSELVEPAYTSELSKTPSDDVILREFYASSQGDDEPVVQDKENMVHAPSGLEEEDTQMEEPSISKPAVKALKDNNVNKDMPLASEVTKRRAAEKRNGLRLKKPRTHV